VELVLVIVIVGILATIAANRMASVTDTVRVEETRREMDVLSMAIVGNPDIQTNGIRSDFGYVGDVGSFPPNLDALTTNPGYSTWNGPYVTSGILQDPDDYKTDAWQTQYTYNGNVAISSVGSGTALVRNLASSPDQIIYNRVRGNIYDYDGTPPGFAGRDSVTILLRVPDGIGGIAVKTTKPDAGGYFAFDSIPIGNHDLDIIYLPQADTLHRFAAVLPNSRGYSQYYLSGNFWSSAAGGGTLIAHWKFDESSGDVASDASGHGFNGTLINMDPGSDWVTGTHDGALDFDGNNDMVQIPHRPEFDLSDAYTVSGWFKMRPQDKDDYRSIITKEVNWTDRDWWICVRQNGTLWWKFSSGGAQYSINPTGNVADNSWHHFAIIYDGSAQTARLYVDGSVPSGGSLNGVPAIDVQDEPIKIGSGWSGRYFKGQIDDIRIYNYALTSGEVAALAN